MELYNLHSIEDKEEEKKKKKDKQVTWLRDFVLFLSGTTSSSQPRSEQNNKEK